jgi:hypothetical protein
MTSNYMYTYEYCQSRQGTICDEITRAGLLMKLPWLGCSNENFHILGTKAIFVSTQLETILTTGDDTKISIA